MPRALPRKKLWIRPSGAPAPVHRRATRCSHGYLRVATFGASNHQATPAGTRVGRVATFSPDVAVLTIPGTISAPKVFVAATLASPTLLGRNAGVAAAGFG